MADNDKQVTEFNEYDIKVRMQLAETSFKSVLDSNVHEDNKAGRILSAMAFLTAAAAGIFNIAYSHNPSTEALEQVLTPYVSKPKLLSAVNDVAGILQKPELIPGLSTPILAFSAYILFVLIGSVCYLQALGPSFNWPSKPEKKNKLSLPPKSEKKDDFSLLFFKGIVPRGDEWGKYWAVKPPDAKPNEEIQNPKPNEETQTFNTNEQIQSQLFSNYINECMLIAQKEKTKVEWMMVGSRFFISAIFFLAVLTATLILPDIIVQISFGVLLLFFLVYFLLYFLRLYWSVLKKMMTAYRDKIQQKPQEQDQSTKKSSPNDNLSILQSPSQKE